MTLVFYTLKEKKEWKQNKIRKPREKNSKMEYIQRQIKQTIFQKNKLSTPNKLGSELTQVNFAYRI